MNLKVHLTNTLNLSEFWGNKVMGLRNVTRTYKHLKRYRQILNILVKYGFGFFVEKFGFLQRLSNKKFIAKRLGIEKLSAPERLRLALEELGPTFIKLGQILSIRPDIILSEYISELVKLQDNVKEFDSALAKGQLEESIRRSIESVFLEFDNAPIASGSIAQVHRAVLKSGEQVVIKIQRPDIEKIIETDMEILFSAARFLETKIPELKAYNPVGIVEEFSDVMQKELDFTKEAWNIEKFSKNFEDSEKIIVPKIYWDITNKKVLVMQFIEGTKINELDRFSSEDRKMICEALANASMKQIFEDGFFHADPHPGNILVTPQRNIAYLDFGMTGRLNKKMMAQIAELLIGVIEVDEDRITDAFLDIGIINDDVNIGQFKLDIYDIIESYHGKTLKQIDLVKFLNEVFKTAIIHGIVMPSEFTLLIKVFVVVEGICRELYAEFNIVEFAQPYVAKLIKERLNIKSILKESAYKLRDTNRHLMVIPSMLNDFLRKANSGKLKFDFQHRGLEEFMPELNKMVNKLALSIIIAALLVGSALVIQVNRGPLLYGFPIIGVLGFSFAAVLGLWLAFTIIRFGKM